MKLRIHQLLGIAELQGRPHTGRRRYGVPPGGAFDQVSLSYANGLCGNELGSPALEIATTAFGDAPFLTAECEEAGTIALAGAECQVQIDGMETRGQGRLALEAGSHLQVSLRRRGMRVYLAAPGQLSYEGKVLASEGTHLESARLDQLPESLDSGPLRYVPIDQEAGEESNLVVEPHSNRVGLRLSGYGGGSRLQKESEPSILGAIQITPGGELLVHGPDGPTTGGYPKIGVVISADCPRLAQLRPGQAVTLSPVSQEEALRLREAHLREVSTRTQSLARLLAS